MLICTKFTNIMYVEFNYVAPHNLAIKLIQMVDVRLTYVKLYKVIPFCSCDESSWNEKSNVALTA